MHQEEFHREIDRFLEVARRSVRRGDIPAMGELEEGMREAALRDGSKALSRLLSEIPDCTKDGVFCAVCGAPMIIVGRREKEMVSLLGDGTLSRMYFVCTNPNCGEHRFPKDEMLDMADTMFSPGVRRLMAKSGSKDAFWTGKVDLKEYSCIDVCSKDVERISESIGGEIEKRQNAERDEMLAKAPPVCPDITIPVFYVEGDGTGVPVVHEEVEGRKGKQEDGSAKTREVKVGCVFTQTTTDEKGHAIRDESSTTYVGAIETAGEFGNRLYAESVRRGLWNAAQVVVLGDGALWFRNLVDEHFYGAIHIVDYYHAEEHLNKLLYMLFHTEAKINENRPLWKKLLEGGKIEDIVNAARQLMPDSEEGCKDIDREIGYFNDNAERMRYSEFKQRGFFVGSGVVEAGCKNVIGKRLKQSGMHWSVRGANSIIALRCCIFSGRFDEFWEDRAAG